MSSNHKTIVIMVVCLLGGAASYRATIAVENQADNGDWESAYRQGSGYYQNKETDKAIAAFKQALISLFGELTVDQINENEETLRELFDNEEDAATARYKLGLIYESQEKLEEAAAMFDDSLHVVLTKGATYLGYRDGCKSCHFKEWKSWKKTKMAKAFETLKPGVSAEAKKELNLDPGKDYTEDPNCLICHTTGFGLPGGYVIPRGAKYKVREASKQTEGGTCEVCHGPGSKYGPIHKDVDDKARKYKPEEFYAAGEYRVDERVCRRCHNRRNPGAPADFKFDFEEQKDKDTHENFSLMYRVDDETASTPADPNNKGSHP